MEGGKAKGFRATAEDNQEAGQANSKVVAQGARQTEGVSIAIELEWPTLSEFGNTMLDRTQVVGLA